MGLGEAITGYLQYFPNLKFRDFHEMESHSFKTLILILSEIGECQPQPRSQEFFPGNEVVSATLLRGLG